MAKGNGTKPTARDLRLAQAIASAIHATLGPEIASVRQSVDTLREDLGSRIDQLRDASVGVGRMAKLEARVDALERERQR